MRVLNTQRDRVLAFLAKGPARCAEISAATGISSASASRAATGLVKDRLLKRIDRNEQYATYALVGRPGRTSNTLHGAAYRAAEDAYVAARKHGKRAIDIAKSLDLTPTSAEAFENAYRYQSSSGSSLDSSSPRFAHDDKHLAALAKLGSFPGWPSLAELRGRA